MATKKQTEAGPAGPGVNAPGSGARKAWKKKTPVEIVVEQIDKLRDEVAKDEEALKTKRRQLQKMEEARKLFNYGFHSFDRRALYGAGDRVGAAAVYGGESDEVPLVTEGPIALFVPRGESDRLVAKIVYTGPLPAPVEAGKDAARLKIWRGDMLVVDAPLKTGASVALGGLTRRAFDAGIELAGDAVRRALKKQ